MSLYRTVIGVDPGRTGGFAALGTRLGLPQVFNMPGERDRGLDLDELTRLLGQFKPADCLVYLEWNNARPGEVPDYAMRAGLQIGQIHGTLHAHGFTTRLLAPQKWTGYFGFPGKTNPDAIPIRARFWDEKFPAFKHLIRGPRGGILDGRLDALLICYYGWLGETSVCGLKGGRKAMRILE